MACNNVCVCMQVCVHIVCVYVCACDQEYATPYLSDFIILMITEVGERHYQSTTNLEFLKSYSSLSIRYSYACYLHIQSL